MLNGIVSIPKNLKYAVFSLITIFNNGTFVEVQKNSGIWSREFHLIVKSAKTINIMVENELKNRLVPFSKAIVQIRIEILFL
ncbi:hypothetical protein DCC39_13490 [Pueribacillus theae]|uniref:Uncharacterized protein n=1 Tax=Pueribacillus theae TaxID=2171751 RepID=A0A2U1JWQ5_9BACI|nr:hypothetical protein DCC39_13490 [Pueribacillus theae]